MAIESQDVATELEEVQFGSPLHEHKKELSGLIGKIESGSLDAGYVQECDDGDLRYWDVSDSASPVIPKLEGWGEKLYRERVGEPPAQSFVMVNRINPSDAPEGSGGGWHRDSFREQYKAFVYLNTVDTVEKGPFCYVSGSNNPIVRGFSAVYRLVTGGHRYPPWLVNLGLSAGLQANPVLAQAGHPFFVQTSLLHRGLPITQGERYAATLYMFGDDDESFEVEGHMLVESQ
jgi:hypothetical protein